MFTARDVYVSTASFYSFSDIILNQLKTVSALVLTRPVVLNTFLLNSTFLHLSDLEWCRIENDLVRN